MEASRAFSKAVVLAAKPWFDRLTTRGRLYHPFVLNLPKDRLR
jgi:hypothetical protein